VLDADDVLDEEVPLADQSAAPGLGAAADRTRVLAQDVTQGGTQDLPEELVLDFDLETADLETADLLSDDPGDHPNELLDDYPTVDLEQSTTSDASARRHDADQPPTGGSAYTWSRPSAELTTWWWALPEQTRTALAALRPGETLNPACGHAVKMAGLPCPQVPAVVRGQRVLHLVATAPLVRMVHLIRMTHSERRLV
jgi:uncharacterized protein (DUF433 family)